MAIALSSPLILPLLLFGGFFINSRSVSAYEFMSDANGLKSSNTSTVPVYFDPLKYVSWFYYGNEALIITQWKNVKNITCEQMTSKLPTQEHRCLTKGLSVIEEFSFGPDNILLDICALITLIIVMRLAAYFALFVRSKRR